MACPASSRPTLTLAEFPHSLRPCAGEEGMQASSMADGESIFSSMNSFHPASPGQLNPLFVGVFVEVFRPNKIVVAMVGTGSDFPLCRTGTNVPTYRRFLASACKGFACSLGTKGRRARQIQSLASRACFNFLSLARVSTCLRHRLRQGSFPFSSSVC